MDTQEYGLGIDAIGIGLSEMKAITSVKADGKTYLNGRVTVAGNPPGAFTKLGRLAPGIDGDLVVSVDEGMYPLYGDKVMDAMAKLGWTHVHSQHSGRKLLLSFYRSDNPATTLYGLTGTTFPGGDEGSQGKAGNKRDRVFGALDSPGAGAFVCRESSQWPTDSICDLRLPDGESLRVLVVPSPCDSNDGDALISLQAAEALAEAAEISRKDWAELDHIQFQIRTKGRFLKAMGQVPTEWPEEWSEYDVVIGEPGVSSATSTDVTVGKVTFHFAPRRDVGFRVADGLESVPNVLLKYYRAQDLVEYGQLVAIRKLLEDQHRTLSANPSEISDADYFDEAAVEARKRRQEEEMLGRIWEDSNEEEKQFAQLVRDWTRSIYGHAVALGNANLAANVVRGILKKAATTTDQGEGMPYAILPGHYLNRAWHRFSGVEEPPYGMATIVFRNDNTPYLFVLNDQQVGNPDIQLRDSTPDNDDHWLSTVGRDSETGEFYLVAARQPNEPDGGQHYRLTQEQAAQWAETRPIMPLRSGWGHRVPSLVELDSQFSLTERTETQAPTHDLSEITAYCRWAIGEGRNVAEYANGTQALFNSGASVGETYSCSSDLLDNIWLQKFRGQQIVEQVMAKAVAYIDEGRPWHRPSYVRIRRRVEELYQQQNGKEPSVRFGSYPDLERLYTGVRDLDDMLDFEASILKGFCNGPYPMLTRQVNESTAAIAAQTVVAVKQEWQNWGREKNRIMRNYRLSFAIREERVAQATANTMARIRARVLADYDRSKDNDDFISGQYAAALTQAQAAHAPRWERPNGQYRVTKARKQMPRPAYQLILHLPEHELRRCYERGHDLAERSGTGTGPTWVSRIRMLGDETTPYTGEWVTVAKGDNGRYQMLADTTGEVLGYLEREAVGIDGMTVKFMGTVPQYSSVTEDAFYQDLPLAVFSCRHEEVLDRVNRKRHAAQDAIAAKCQASE